MANDAARSKLNRTNYCKSSQKILTLYKIAISRNNLVLNKKSFQALDTFSWDFYIFHIIYFYIFKKVILC